MLSSLDESNATTIQGFYMTAGPWINLHTMYMFSVVVYYRKFDTTVTQAVRGIGQRYHRYKQKNARNKANTMHKVEKDMAPWLFHFSSALSYRLYRCIVVKYFRYIFHDSGCHWCHRWSDLGYIAINVRDNTRIYPNLSHP